VRFSLISFCSCLPKTHNFVFNNTNHSRTTLISQPFSYPCPKILLQLRLGIFKGKTYKNLISNKYIDISVEKYSPYRKLSSVLSNFEFLREKVDSANPESHAITDYLKLQCLKS